MFLPDSLTGSDLKTIEIEDFSNYIKVKRPSQIVIIKEMRGEDYCKEVSSNKIDQNLLKYEKEYKAVRLRHTTSISDTDPQRIHLFINFYVFFKLLLNEDPWFCPFPLIIEIFMTEIHQILLYALYFRQTTFTSIDFFQKQLLTYYFRSY